MKLNALIILIPLFGMFVPIIVMFLWIKRQETADRRSPLTEDLLRLPGESLNEQHRETSFDLCAILLVSVLVPSIGLVTLLNSWVDPEKIRLNGIALFCSLLIGGSLLWALLKTLRLLRTLSTTRRGLAGELATAQLLTPLLADGWKLFHDLPIKRGNIDHVLVGPTGVYAIETKYRSKRQSLKGQAAVQAKYDGNCIHFAGGSNEWLPVQQAQAVASELSKWLHGKIGEPVGVVPVVALPGWYITNTKKPADGQVQVINPKNHHLFRTRPQQMSSALQVRISAALRELAIKPSPGNVQ